MHRVQTREDVEVPRRLLASWQRSEDYGVSLESVDPVFTGTSDLGTNFQPKFMKDAPLFVGGGFRNPENFISFMPGVNNGQQDTSIDGGPRRSKEILIDGATHTNPESGGVAFVSNGGIGSVEQYGEFKILNANFSAEYGHTGGGIEIFVTKSGANTVRGSGFEFFERQVRRCRSVHRRQRRFPTAIHATPPNPRCGNEFGFNVGGPVWIPKVYNGRNKTFFFFTRNWYRQANAFSTGIATVATSLMKSGDFSELGSKLIYDPASTATVNGVVTRTPFSGNKIPAGQFSAVSKNILPLIPSPTGSGISSNFSVSNKGVKDLDIWSLKLDHSFSDRKRVSVFGSLQNITQLSEGGLPGAGVWLAARQAEDLSGQPRLQLSPTFINHFLFGFSQYNNFFDQLPQHK
jgi:hypothetical protein